MSDPPTGAASHAEGNLLDKYTLPKIALAVILAASLVGTWVTSTLSDHAIVLVAAKWAYFVSLGVLTGGLVWKHAFVRPDDLATEARAYCREMYDRFDRFAVGSLVVLVVSGSLVFRTYVARFGLDLPTFGFGAVLLSSSGAVTVTTLRTQTADDQFRNPVGIAALVLAVIAVVATAGMEVRLRGFGVIAAAVRALHLLAFAVWVGGAVWNIFVAVPTGRQRPTTAVARAAGEQLERFRWTVRLIIPTLFLTGVYQAIDALGTAVGTYAGSLVGIAVLAKIGFIGSLVVIFKLCPMWRACSPIDGVCDLDDLGSEPRSDGDPAAQSGVSGDD